MRISKSQLKKIISEELQKESAILDRAIKRGLAPTKGSSTPPTTEKPPEQSEPEKPTEPAAKPPAAGSPGIRTISLRDVMKELADDMGRGSPDRPKLTKLYDLMKKNKVTNTTISSREKGRLQQKFKNLKSQYQQKQNPTEEEEKDFLSKASKIAGKMSKYVEAEKLEKKITSAFDGINKQLSKELGAVNRTPLSKDILRKLLGIIFQGGRDNIRIVESVIERIIFENLKGNKVIL